MMRRISPRRRRPKEKASARSASNELKVESEQPAAAVDSRGERNIEGEIELALHMLSNAKEGNWSVVYEVLDKHPHLVNVQNTWSGYSVLHQACWWGFEDVMVQLLKRGADPYLISNDGNVYEVGERQGHGRSVNRALNEISNGPTPRQWCPLCTREVLYTWAHPFRVCRTCAREAVVSTKLLDEDAVLADGEQRVVESSIDEAGEEWLPLQVSSVALHGGAVARVGQGWSMSVPEYCVVKGRICAVEMSLQGTVVMSPIAIEKDADIKSPRASVKGPAGVSADRVTRGRAADRSEELLSEPWRRQATVVNESKDLQKSLMIWVDKDDTPEIDDEALEQSLRSSPNRSGAPHEEVTLLRCGSVVPFLSPYWTIIEPFYKPRGRCRAPARR